MHSASQIQRATLASSEMSQTAHMLHGISRWHGYCLFCSSAHQSSVDCITMAMAGPLLHLARGDAAS